MYMDMMNIAYETVFYILYVQYLQQTKTGQLYVY